MSSSQTSNKLSAEPTNSVTCILEAIRLEFVRYKTLAERAFAQIPDVHLNSTLGAGTNSVSTLIQHLAGNLKSRYTDFMIKGSDGEKSWRNRDGEFVETKLSRRELLLLWDEGTKCFENALARLRPDDLLQTVFIRGTELDVAAALQRSLAHYTYHVGQMIMICRIFTGESVWKPLTVLTTDENRGADSDASVRW